MSCVGGGRGPGSDRFVQQRGDVLLLVAVCGTEHHHAILDGERVEVIEHDVVGFGQ